MPVADAAPKLAFYGDDFTGASDTLATLAQAGQRVVLFLDVPSPARLAAVGPLDAIGIAGATRSMAPAAIGAALAPVADFFARCGARVLHYKVCSTFDSAPDVGNIAAAIDTLHAALRNRLVAIVGGQPSLGRHCAFGHLFATDASGTPLRIDRHPTMSRHPVTPMRESDLREHLRAQGLATAGLVDCRLLDAAHERLDAAIDAMLRAREPSATRCAVLFDAVRDADLAAIGRLLWQRSQQAPLLAVGASSVAQALIDHWACPRTSREGRVPPARGPVFVLAGSLSPLTARQIAASPSFLRVPLDPARMVRGEALGALDRIVGALRDGRNVLAHTTPAATAGRAAVDAVALAAASGTLLRRVLLDARVTRAGVAGGDTSSHSVQALGGWGLTWIGRPSPGVALCRLHADDARLDGVELMLKGGQMGGEDLFERLAAGT